jgi:predicted dehydrogenase
VRVGFVGAGAIAQRHLGVLAKRGDVEVAAVCDLDTQRAQAAADLTGATAHADWQSMLDGVHLDALFVCTPPANHAEPAVAAIGRGVPVYLEKPLARTLRPSRQDRCG